MGTQNKNVKMLQSDIYSTFGQLYIPMQSRDSDSKEFFSHEIQSFPPSLPDQGVGFIYPVQLWIAEMHPVKHIAWAIIVL